MLPYIGFAILAGLGGYLGYYADIWITISISAVVFFWYISLDDDIAQGIVAIVLFPVAVGVFVGGGYYYFTEYEKSPETEVKVVEKVVEVDDNESIFKDAWEWLNSTPIPKEK